MAVTDRRYGVAEGQAVKSPCVAATTANITLGGEQTIDGVSCVDGDRVLVKNQSTASQNGIYVCSTGNWVRSKDFDGGLDVVKGSRVWVNGGSINGSMEFFVTTADPITIDSSSIAFSSLTVLLNAAPGNADYLVKTANGTLTAERVVTDTASVIWDFATAAQAKANVPASTTAASGAVELATSAEAITGTDAARAVTPAALAATIAAVSPALPRGYIDGCILSNNVSDATNDIDVSAGVCRDSTNAVNITCAAMTKRLDASWAPGTNQGGRDSSAVITNATYHWYAVSKADGTQDYYETTAATEAAAITAIHSESGGALYLYARRIGSILRESAAIVPFVQDGDYFQRKTTSADVSASNDGTAAVLRTLSIPVGLKLRAEIHCIMTTNDAAITSLLVTDPDTTDETPTTTLTNFVSVKAASGGTAFAGADMFIRSNTSAQVRSRLSANSAQINLTIRTRGWIDSRGKNA